jgi:CBS domain containing-hemolysin-like protein
MNSWLPFLAFSLICIFSQGLFALFEMSCVSFNKVRLHYLANSGKKRAIWLNKLISRPSQLFGTTLIGINAFLQLGSECSRRFYEELNLNPDLAPISQVILVLLFGEFIPLFAARRHPEKLAIACAPLMILISKLLTPLIIFFELLAKGIHLLFKTSVATPSYLSREEVQKAFEEEPNELPDPFNSLVSNVFRINTLTARHAMTPIQTLKPLDSELPLSAARSELKTHSLTFIPVYYRTPQNIVSIVHLRDLLDTDPKKKIADLAKPAWFITEETPLFKILQQFRSNNQTTAVILSSAGQASGILSLDQILDTLLGPQKSYESEEKKLYIERTVSGSLLASEFNRAFSANLKHRPGDTLSDLIVEELSHAPVKGESVEIGSYELTVLEPSFRGAKIISVKTIE